MSEYTWEPAKITEVDVGFEDHGIFTLFATFDYGGAGQGLNYAVDQEFIERFIVACGVNALSKCKNRIVMVLHGHDNIKAISPMKFEKGKPFDIEIWSTRAKVQSAKGQK